MTYLMTDDGPSRRPGRPGFEGTLSYKISTSDVRPLVRGELNALQKSLRAARNTSVNTVTKYHYEDAIARIDAILEPK